MQLAESIGRGLAKAAVAGKVDDKVVDLSHKLTGEHEVSILTDRDPDALLVLRHSTAHVMAEAIQRLWPEAKLAYGPALEKASITTSRSISRSAHRTSKRSKPR